MIRKVLVIMLSSAIVVGPVLSQADEPITFSKFFRHKPEKETAVVQFARTLDDLEKKLDLDGTVVAKAPDIWGEARLTKHREEFEREMAKEIENFDFRINAAISRTDQAFLANALAISSIGAGTKLKADGTPDVPTALNVSQAASLLPGLATEAQPASSTGGATTNQKNEVIVQTRPKGCWMTILR